MSAPHMRSVHLVEAAEAGVAFLAHVALEDLRVRLALVLERYMGKEGYAGFRRFHKMD